MSEASAQSTLSEAFEQIRAGKYDDARAALKRVSQALPNSAVAREADRGAVAIYKARSIASAQADQRAALAEKAKKDFASSMWVGLF